MNDAWRERLREAIRRSGRKQSDIAQIAGVTDVTLSRILNAVDAKPAFDTVVRIAFATGVTVGWLLNEEELPFGPWEREQIRHAAKVILALTGQRVGTE